MSFLTSAGLGFLKLIALFLPIIVAGYVGTEMSKRGVRTWLCWTVGIVVLCALGAVFWPAVDVLASAACKGANDYQACIEDTGPDDWI